MNANRGKSRLLLILSLFLVFSMIFAACNGNEETPEEEVGVVEEPTIVEEEGLVEEEAGVLEEAETETEEVIEETEAETEEVIEETEAETEEVTEEAEGAVEETEAETEELVSETEAETEEAVGEAAGALDVAALEEGFEVEEGEGIASIQNVLVGATTLMNFPVDNPADEDLGQMNDLIIDLSTGNIPYAVMETGEFLGLGGEDVLVPMSLLFLGENGNELILPMTAGNFEGIPTLEDNWEEGFAAGVWDDQALEFWRGTAWGENLQDIGEGNLVLWSDVTGFGAGYGADAGVAADEGLGAALVSDILIDMGMDRARWVVLDAGLDDLVLVPFSAFDMEAFGEQFVFGADVDPEVLQGAPLVARDDLTTGGFYDPAFDDEIVTYWEERGFEVEDEGIVE